MQKTSTGFARIIVPIAIALTGVSTMALLAHLLDNGTIPLWEIHHNNTVNLTFTLQMMMLPLSFVVVALIWIYDRQNFTTFFRIGISFNVDKNTWASIGPIATVGITIGNVMLMSFGVVSQHGTINSTFVSLLPLVLLFASTNAWIEEIFTRLAIVAGLYGRINPITICWISAIIFGVPHFLGTPSGTFGIITSGALGWLLARSVIDTKGLGWAWLIHFLQDVVIFGAGAMIIAGN